MSVDCLNAAIMHNLQEYFRSKRRRSVAASVVREEDDPPGRLIIAIKGEIKTSKQVFQTGGEHSVPYATGAAFSIVVNAPDLVLAIMEGTHFVCRAEFDLCENKSFDLIYETIETVQQAGASRARCWLRSAPCRCQYHPVRRTGRVRRR